MQFRSYKLPIPVLVRFVTVTLNTHLSQGAFYRNHDILYCDNVINKINHNNNYILKVLITHLITIPKKIMQNSNCFVIIIQTKFVAIVKKSQFSLFCVSVTKMVNIDNRGLVTDYEYILNFSESYVSYS